MDMYSAVDGHVGDFHLVHLGARALGGAGLVISEMLCVSERGSHHAGLRRPLGRTRHAAEWRRIVDFVHASSDAKICASLGTPGGKGSTKLLWEGNDEPLESGNWPLIAPSPLPYLPVSQVPREMEERDFADVTAWYVRAARLAEQRASTWSSCTWRTGTCSRAS